MRIGQMVSNMMMIARNQNLFSNQYNQYETQVSTGKRVNTAADDPSAIGRIERTQAQINQSETIQTALSDALNRNSTMENTLTSLNSTAGSLSNIASQLTEPGADTTTLKSQASSLLDSMVATMASTQFNGSNPFTDGTASYGVSGGSSITVNSPKFNIVKNATNPATYDITLNDGTVLSGQTVDNILTSNFIQTNLTNQISSAQSSMGTSDQIINFRKDFESNQEATLTKTLSNLQDADISKATVNAAVANQMLSVNQTLLSAYSSSFQNEIGSILNVRA